MWIKASVDFGGKVDCFVIDEHPINGNAYVVLNNRNHNFIFWKSFGKTPLAPEKYLIRKRVLFTKDKNNHYTFYVG